MRYTAITPALTLFVLLGATSAGEPAVSATEVRPLLIGAELPPLTLRTAEGEAFDLDGAVAKKPTILILYRGGW